MEPPTSPAPRARDPGPTHLSAPNHDAVAVGDAEGFSGAGEVVDGGLDFVAGGAGGGVFAAQGGFDEQHSGVEREDRGGGGGDLAGDRALRGVAFSAQEPAHDFRALLGAVTAVPFDVVE